MITDTCPCVYPDNYASNKRWCCGDMYHLDLSVWAYEKVRVDTPQWSSLCRASACLQHLVACSAPCNTLLLSACLSAGRPCCNQTPFATIAALPPFPVGRQEVGCDWRGVARCAVLVQAQETGQDPCRHKTLSQALVGAHPLWLAAVHGPTHRQQVPVPKRRVKRRSSEALTSTQRQQQLWQQCGFAHSLPLPKLAQAPVAAPQGQPRSDSARSSG